MASSSFYSRNPTPSETQDLETLLEAAKDVAQQVLDQAPITDEKVQEATTQATNATISAQAASDSASDALASKNAAAVSAASAAESATTAAVGISQFNVDAAQITAAASNATTSASNAATSASNAATSATSAFTSKTDAEAAATAAQTAKSAAEDAMATKAPLDSPVFTGTPKAPNQSGTDSSTKVATTKQVSDAIASKVITPLGGDVANPIFAKVCASVAGGLSAAYQWIVGGFRRWEMSTLNGNPDQFLFSYFDAAGAYKGTPIWTYGTSGPQNSGVPLLSLGPTNFVQSRPHYPSGAAGLQQSWTVEVPASVVPDCISTQSGSTTITITWPGHVLQATHLVKVSGASPVGGLTVDGWYLVTGASGDTFTITATGPATSTAGPAGGNVSLKPNYPGNGVNTVIINKSAVGSFTGGYSTVVAGKPETNTKFGYNLLGQWLLTYGPKDKAGVMESTTTYGLELDLINRAKDYGWSPDFTVQNSPNSNLVLLNENGIGDVDGDGAVGGNSFAAISVSRSGNYCDDTGAWAQYYHGLATCPGTFVAKSRDPNGHGGVGLTLWGGTTLISGIDTVSGSQTVTIRLLRPSPSVKVGQQFQILKGVTQAGLGFGIEGVFTVASVDNPTQFKITHPQVASSTTTGNVGAYLDFANERPSNPLDIRGGWYAGIDFSNSNFTTGCPLHLASGQGIRWSDGSILYENAGSGDLVFVNKLGHSITLASGSA